MLKEEEKYRQIAPPTARPRQVLQVQKMLIRHDTVPMYAFRKPLTNVF